MHRFSRLAESEKKALSSELRRQRACVLIKVLARRLSPADRAAALIEWEMLCVAHDLQPRLPGLEDEDEALPS